MPSIISRIVLMVLFAHCAVPANGERLDAGQQRAVIDKMAELIKTDLFDPDAAEPYLDYLAFTARTLTHPIQADDFALKLHRGLQEVTRDGHLGVYGPRRAAAIMGQPMFESGADDAAELPHDSHGPDDEVATFSVSQPSSQAALIRMSSFPTTEDVGDALLAELTRLPDEIALIFDLRGNTGGDAKLFRRIAGCLFDTSMPLFAIRWREPHGMRIAESRVEPNSACQHLNDSPVVILVDQRTASVGELMPFILQARGRALIIGQPTYAASHAAEFYPLPSGLGLMLPIGATYDPITGANWESDGITPDVLTLPDTALDKARSVLETLSRCQDTFGPSWRCDIQGTTVSIEE